MLDPKKIEKFARYLHNSAPKIIHNFTYNFDLKIKKILQKQINRMNFVDRDEFDMQTKILFETQEKLQKLEKRLKNLENLITKLYFSDNNQKT